MDTITLGLGREVAQEGIRVNAVRPGVIDTEIHASGGEPDRIDRIAPTIPMGRGGTAEEVARTIVWAVFCTGSYLTATLVNCSGGR